MRYLLVDCNNFYVSCERVFEPRLLGKPVVVLSNNDGCVIARSEEAKKLCIEMGTPAFKAETLFHVHGVHVYSSNYALYGDMSRRVMETLRGFAPEVEVYSLDEAFLRLTTVDDTEATEVAHCLRRKVSQWTGIDVSVGIASTKTLAKIANYSVKLLGGDNKVLSFEHMPYPDQFLADTPVERVWGIGPRRARFLRRQGVETALALKRAPGAWVRQHLTVSGLRTAMELRGIPCLPWEEAAPGKKSLTCSRSFGRPITCLWEMEEALACYVTRVAEKLRQQGKVASSMEVFVRGGKYAKRMAHGTRSATLRLSPATDYTPELIALAHRLLARIYEPGKEYRKAGVILNHLCSQGEAQLDLFHARSEAEWQRQSSLMRTMDSLNFRFGQDTIFPGSTGLTRPWRMRQERKSPGYTTRWNELCWVRSDIGSSGGTEPRTLE